MKRFMTLLAATALISGAASAQEATLPTPDAKTIGMGGVMMTTLSGSHAIYNNSATAMFQRSPSQISSSYYGQGSFDYYAVSGSCRLGSENLIQAGWRQYLRERGNSDMAVDLGYSRRINDRWAVGIVARYLHLSRPEISADALAADLSIAYQLPLENLGSYSALRAGAKIANLGAYLNDTDYILPMDLTAGVALDTFLSDAHEITVGTDLGYYFYPKGVRGFQMSLGMEYNLMQLVQFRAGYHYGEQRYYYPSYWSVGCGVRILHLRLDFAYLFAPKETLLHNTYSLSFGFDF
ncbi:MAG TPA: PorV/PorQ family protein [Candidatus Alistipes intestinigallinarum]|uniref:PorV/PorQ family protein n=1 Tax=Candidatus Alistipes intestinigallinarum TaxID=2838440 RepID=A0A9D2CD58_9BACT|nr:PorV/PorQ family protein [Candidatus Alistipes intestinigallinarum]